MSKKKRLGKPGATHDAPLDKSPVVCQREKWNLPLEINLRYELNPKQKAFIDIALSKDSRLIICDGLWGSSKTYLSVYCALELLKQKRVDGIIYLRAPIEAGKGIGFLPGEVGMKINPYAEPLYEKLNELLNSSTTKALEQDKRIDIIPPGFIRGRSWNCKAVIVDEAANFDRGMLELILSRMGPFCKVFVIGSRHQSDIKDPSGFTEVFRAFDDEDSKTEGIYTFEFNEEVDIVRSKFVKFVMKKLGVLPSINPKDEPMFPPR